MPARAQDSLRVYTHPRITITGSRIPFLTAVRPSHLARTSMLTAIRTQLKRFCGFISDEEENLVRVTAEKAGEEAGEGLPFGACYSTSLYTMLTELVFPDDHPIYFFHSPISHLYPLISYLRRSPQLETKTLIILLTNARWRVKHWRAVLVSTTLSTPPHSPSSPNSMSFHAERIKRSAEHDKKSDSSKLQHEHRAMTSRWRAIWRGLAGRSLSH